MNEVEDHLAWQRKELARLEQSAAQFEFGRELYLKEAQRVSEEIKHVERALVLAGVA